MKTNELSKSTWDKIDTTTPNLEDYRAAKRFLSENCYGGILPERATLALAKMYAASRQHADIQEEIGENLESTPIWLIAELIAHVGYSGPLNP